MVMLPGDFNDGNEKVSYWVPNDRGIRKVMNSHFNIPLSKDDYEVSNNRYTALEGNRDQLTHPRIRIAVQDSTKDQEVLQSALDTLREAGYKRVYASKNWQQPLKTTRIIAQSGDDEAAAHVQSTLGVGEVVVESTGVLKSDVTIQIGKDWEKYVRLLTEAKQKRRFSKGEWILEKDE